MSANRSEAIIQQYLDQVADHLSDLPPEERAEILSDLRAHIEEAVGDPALASEVDVRNTLDRLGNPLDLAREARERSNDAATAQESSPRVERRLNKTPGALEVAAIIMTAIFWPIGVLLSWVSPRWLTRDKVIATLIPATSTVLLLVIVLGGLVAWGSVATVTYSVEDAAPAEPVEPGGAAPPVEDRSPSVISESGSTLSLIGRLVVVLGFLVGVIAGPFISAVYLAIRLQPVEETVYPASRRTGNNVPARGHA